MKKIIIILICVFSLIAISSLGILFGKAGQKNIEVKKETIKQQKSQISSIDNPFVEFSDQSDVSKTCKNYLNNWVGYNSKKYNIFIKYPFYFSLFEYSLPIKEEKIYSQEYYKDSLVIPPYYLVENKHAEINKNDYIWDNEYRIADTGISIPTVINDSQLQCIARLIHKNQEISIYIFDNKDKLLLRDFLSTLLIKSDKQNNTLSGYDAIKDKLYEKNNFPSGLLFYDGNDTGGLGNARVSYYQLDDKVYKFVLSGATIGEEIDPEMENIYLEIIKSISPYISSRPVS